MLLILLLLLLLLSLLWLSRPRQPLGLEKSILIMQAQVRSASTYLPT